MANDQIPQTVVECDGCRKELNVLAPYLYMQLKAQREVLVSEEQPSEDPNEVATANIYLGTKSGRGVGKKFHSFDCMIEWTQERAGLPAKLEYHTEEGDPYVPEDNPDDEEIERRNQAAAEAEGSVA